MASYDPMLLRTHEPVTILVELGDLGECMSLLNEVCQDLEAEIDARYPDKEHPSQIRRYNRDMTPITRSKAILARLSMLPGTPQFKDQ